ncbi:unnamed protein product [Merluccius merluccius]
MIDARVIRAAGSAWSLRHQMLSWDGPLPSNPQAPARGELRGHEWFNLIVINTLARMAPHTNRLNWGLDSQL